MTTGTPLIELNHLLDNLDEKFIAMADRQPAYTPLCCPQPGCHWSLHGILNGQSWTADARTREYGRHLDDAHADEPIPYSLTDGRCPNPGCGRTFEDCRCTGVRCPAARPDDPTNCDGPPDAVTVYDYPLGGRGQQTAGCEHHATRLYASLNPKRRRVHPGSAGDGSALRVYNAAKETTHADA